MAYPEPNWNYNPYISNYNSFQDEGRDWTWAAGWEPTWYDRAFQRVLPYAPFIKQMAMPLVHAGLSYGTYQLAKLFKRSPNRTQYVKATYRPPRMLGDTVRRFPVSKGWKFYPQYRKRRYRRRRRRRYWLSHFYGKVLASSPKV